MHYLHTMLRVTNLEASIKFYCQGLGFKEISRQDYPKDKFTLVFLSTESDLDRGVQIELTHNWETKSYVRGDAYGHMAYRVKSVETLRSRLKEHGYDLSWGPGRTPNGSRVMAFVDDPDGYEIELLEG